MRKLYSLIEVLHDVSGVQKVLLDIHNGIKDRYNAKVVGLHSKIKVRIDGQMIETTTGRVIFNQIVPKEMGFFDFVVV